MRLTRREFMAFSAAVPFVNVASSRYRIAITTNTRGGWEDDVFLSFRQAREVGFQYVESFIHYFKAYMDKPDKLKRTMEDIGVQFATISNGSPMELHFEDPSRHETILEEHPGLVRFIKQLGCDHLKINTGPRRPEGTNKEDLKHMAAVFDELGRRISKEGLKFGVHAHMWSQLENRREIDAIMERTDPRHVWFILDTGHITMAGIDPLALSQDLGHRIIEFHLKDTLTVHRGGAQKRIERNDPMKDPVFFELGKGGVDYLALKAHLDRIGWQGWLTVELDSSPDRPPKESARISKNYIENTLGLAL